MGNTALPTELFMQAVVGMMLYCGRFKPEVMRYFCRTTSLDQVEVRTAAYIKILESMEEARVA